MTSLVVDVDVDVDEEEDDDDDNAFSFFLALIVRCGGRLFLPPIFFSCDEDDEDILYTHSLFWLYLSFGTALSLE
jgi:hypothetical protein